MGITHKFELYRRLIDCLLLYNNKTWLFQQHLKECTPEVKELKEKVFLQFDKMAEAETILASSSSALPASLFTEKMEKRKKNVIIAHPVR